MGKVVEAVIFDLDGTLIDSKDVYVKLTKEMFRELGTREIPSQDEILEIVRKANGGDLRQIFSGMILGLRAEEFKKAREKVMKIFPEIFRNHVSIIIGSDEFLKHLKRLGIKKGLVTSTRSKYLQVKMYPLRKVGVADLFQAVVCKDDVPKFKPDPCPLVQCAQNLGVSESHCLYVGDSREDMRAGRAAGMRTIGVLTGIGGEEELKAEGADMVVNSVSDLLRCVDILMNGSDFQAYQG